MPSTYTHVIEGDPVEHLLTDHKLRNAAPLDPAMWAEVRGDPVAWHDEDHEHHQVGADHATDWA